MIDLKDNNFVMYFYSMIFLKGVSLNNLDVYKLNMKIIVMTAGIVMI